MGQHAKPLGFTLIELMVGVAIIAIVLAIVVPSFHDFILVQRLKSINAQVVTDLQWARSEAVSRGQPVRVRFQNAAEGSNHDLSCYIVYIDTVLNASADVQFSDPPCDCKAEAGARCSGSPSTTTELRTIQIESSRSVAVEADPYFYNPSGSSPTASDHVGFDPRTGGVSLFNFDPGVVTAPDFTVYATLTASRRYANQVGRTGRVKTCIPSGSTMPGVPCS